MTKFLCDRCGKLFANESELKIHGITHSVIKSFECRTCGQAFLGLKEFQDHERVHSEEIHNRRGKCDVAFKPRSYLQDRCRTNTNAIRSRNKPHECHECGRRYTRKHNLKSHMISAHYGERPHKCSYCDSTFAHKLTLYKHMCIHIERPHICEVCGMAFSNKSNKETHRYVHTEKKRYECKECGMGFMRKKALYNHVQKQGHTSDTYIVNKHFLETVEDLEAKGATDVLEVNRDPKEDQETMTDLSDFTDYVGIEVYNVNKDDALALIQGLKELQSTAFVSESTESIDMNGTEYALGEESV